MIKSLLLQPELPYSLQWLFTYINIWSESARAAHSSLNTCRKLPQPPPPSPSSPSSSMNCRSAVRSSQGAIYERPPVQGSLAAINIAILRQLTSSTWSRLIIGSFLTLPTRRDEAGQKFSGWQQKFYLCEVLQHLWWPQWTPYLPLSLPSSLWACVDAVRHYHIQAYLPLPAPSQIAAQEHIYQ